LKSELISKYIKPLEPQPTSLHQSGALKDKLKCVLFDVYGTLFISASGDIGIARQESQKIDNLKKLLMQFGIDAMPQTILKTFFDRIDEIHQQKRGKGIDFPEVEIDKIWQNVLQISDLEVIRAFAWEFELIVNPVYPMPHLAKVLAGIRQLNIPMGIVSNAQFYTLYLFDWLLNSNLQDLGFDSDLLFLSYQLGFAKPSLRMFQMAAEQLKEMHIPQQAVLYVGNDMLNDIYPAKTVGFQTALFAGDARSLRLRENHPKCRGLSADIVVTDLEQLLVHTHNREGAPNETT
jgi:putative hydrolase of the HAD superfamily